MKVRYYGHVGALTGYGIAAADMCMALLATGQVDLEIRPLGLGAGWTPDEAKLALAGARDSLFAHIKTDPELTAPDVVIVHTLPLDCSRVLATACTEDEDIEGAPWVAYTTWESVSQPPSHLIESLAMFDQLWMPSQACTRALGDGLPADRAHPGWLRVVPHAFDVESLAARKSPYPTSKGPFHAPFVFLYQGAWTSRKNPGGLLRAWAKAFNPDPGVELWLHCQGASPESFAVALHQTGLEPNEMARVRFLPERLPESLMRQQHALVNCFVTASRGEAWNLPAFDALLAGRHVIAPARHGSDDFLRETSADLYSSFEAPALVDVKSVGARSGRINLQVIGAQGLTARSTWLEPNLMHLADLMRRAYQERTRDLRIDYDVAERFGYAAVGKLALSHLEEL